VGFFGSLLRMAKYFSVVVESGRMCLQFVHSAKWKRFLAGAAWGGGGFAGGGVVWEAPAAAGGGVDCEAVDKITSATFGLKEFFTEKSRISL
jgi:hypothetical protein